MNLSSAISEALVKSIFMRIFSILFLVLGLTWNTSAQESAIMSQLDSWFDLVDRQPELIKNKCDSLLQNHNLSSYEKTLAYHVISDCYYYLNDMNQSDIAIKKAIEFMPEDYDMANQILMYNAHGQNQHFLGNRTNAIKIFEKGLIPAQQLRDTQELAYLYDNIANSYITLNNIDQASAYLDSALTCYYTIPDSGGILSILDKQAGNLKLNEDYDAALEVYHAGLKLVPQSEPSWKDQLLIRISIIHQLNENFDSLLIYAEKINQSTTEHLSAEILIDKYGLQAYVDLVDKDTINAIANFDTCAMVADQIGILFEYYQCKLQSEIIKATSAENVKTMSNILAEMDSQEMKRLSRVGYDILARKYTHLNNSKEAYKNLRKSVELSYELNRESTQRQFAKLSVDFELKEKEYELQLAKEREEAKTKQMISYGITFGSLALLLFGFLQYRNRKTKLTLETEKLQQEKSLIQEISNLESKAFRAQMNPHFIFNALNSIKGLVIQQKTEKAADYISDFSKLMRSILENSMSKTISLQNELETLERYIKLEQMRFQGNFHYEIDIEEDLDIDHIMVPPIIVQPFVENAIWHGFSDRKENNRLLVRIYADEELHIIVDDNGVGRAVKQDHKVQKSYGVSITQQRIWNFSGDEKLDRLVYQDRKSDELQNRGTMVSISLPIKYKH